MKYDGSFCTPCTSTSTDNSQLRPDEIIDQCMTCVLSTIALPLYRKPYSIDYEYGVIVGTYSYWSLAPKPVGSDDYSVHDIIMDIIMDIIIMEYIIITEYCRENLLG